MPKALHHAVIGFVAAVVAVLTFHQGMWALLHVAGLMPAPYPTDPIPPFGVPRIVNLCFWGGVWGAVFGWVLPGLPRSLPIWVSGLLLGIAAALFGLFVVPLIKGVPIAGGWDPMAFIRSLLINGTWGIGVGLILSLMLPRVRLRSV